VRAGQVIPLARRRASQLPPLADPAVLFVPLAGRPRARYQRQERGCVK